jgi:hypothetical protein
LSRRISARKSEATIAADYRLPVISIFRKRSEKAAAECEVIKLRGATAMGPVNGLRSEHFAAMLRRSKRTTLVPKNPRSRS